jgi:hypothetical protein
MASALAETLAPLGLKPGTYRQTINGHTIESNVRVGMLLGTSPHPTAANRLHSNSPNTNSVTAV